MLPGYIAFGPLFKNASVPNANTCLLNAVNIESVIIFIIVPNCLLTMSLSVPGLILLHIVIALSAGRTELAYQGEKLKGSGQDYRLYFAEISLLSRDWS